MKNETIKKWNKTSKYVAAGLSAFGGALLGRAVKRELKYYCEERKWNRRTNCWEISDPWWGKIGAQVIGLAVTYGGTILLDKVLDMVFHLPEHKDTTPIDAKTADVMDLILAAIEKAKKEMEEENNGSSDITTEERDGSIDDSTYGDTKSEAGEDDQNQE